MQDEYDDLLISNIELTTDVESDDNYCLMFVRKKKEAFLSLNDRAKQELAQVSQILLQLNNIYGDKSAFIDKYLAGKRDHTIDRYWNLQKGVLAWGVGYLLLREVKFYPCSSPFATSTQDPSSCSSPLLCTTSARAPSTPSPPTTSSSRTSSLTRRSETTRPIPT